MEHPPGFPASRRELLVLAAIAAGNPPLLAAPSRRIRAIAFDAFVLFDPRTILDRAMSLVGERGRALVSAASAKLFGYTWYYTSAGHYAGFNELAADAFASAAEALGLKLSKSGVNWLVDGYASLELWPDVPAALQLLRRDGVRLAMLSNLSELTLRKDLRGTGIEHLFEFVLSTDQARQYKPSPRAYDLAVRAFRLSKAEIGFAASASWDASGATWFGFPTVWVNRNALASEQAHVAPALVATGMDGVLRLARVWAT